MPEIVGDSGNNTLTGTAGADIIRGLGGNDTIYGGDGFDELYGGQGDDIYYIDDNAGDVVRELIGEGFDQIYVALSYVLEANSEVEYLSANNWSATSAINLTGNHFAQTLVGNAGANILNGGGGADILHGQAGNDIYYLDVASVQVVEVNGGGSDAVYSSISYTLGGSTEVELLSANDYAATTALNFTGNSFAQTLVGNSGANILNGGGGADILHGQGGNDIYYVDFASVQVVENSGAGNDGVYTSVSYVLTAGAEVETLSTNSHAATSAISLTGNSFAQALVGNAGNNILNGGGGNDILYGFGGNDIYYVDIAAVQIQEAQGGGTNSVYTSVSYTLTAGMEIEILSTNSHAATTAINLTGNGIANQLYGNEGANILNGGGGADLLTGFGGNDIYYVDFASVQIAEAAAGGNDAIYTSVSYALAAGVEVETLSTNSHAGTGAIDLTGNAGANTLAGNAGANILNGGAGSDTIFGFGGADTFAFTTALGAGNVDILVDFSVVDDTIQLGGGGGEPFVGLATGTLRSGTFVVGAAALDADDYLIYNSTTGALLYDADGNGAGAAVQFATLSTGLGLTAADFIVSGAANTAPAITSAATAQIAENSAAATIVYQVAATDADGDRITYSLSGADAALLTIDGNGAVRLITPADFETKATYAFNVVASDSGVSTSKAVTLTITDVAEGGPSTPIINETGGANDSTGAAQAIDRNILIVANNPNLPNDDLPSATIVGNISTPTDKDFFSITLQAGERLILDVDNSSGTLDTHIRVYGPNGVEIGDNDDAGGLDPGSAAHPTYGHNTDSFFSFRAATSGTYYFSLESFQDPNNPSSGTYEINVSVGPPATAAQLLEEDIDALVSGAEWPTNTITYSFPDSPGDYPAGFGDPEDPEPPSLLAFTPTQQAAVQLMLQHISGLTALTFQQLTGASDGAAKLRFAMTDGTEAAHAYYPGGSDEAGSAWFNKTSFNTPLKGNYAWMGILHETGHALGLKHGHEPPAISFDRDSLEFTVMTYRSYPGDSVSGGYGNETFGYAQTLMMLDIAALQRIYGANFATNQTDSVYSWSGSTGEMSINGAGQGAPGNGSGGSSNRIFMTIWDGGGNDTYNLSNYGGGVTIDLRPGEWSKTTQAQTANLGGSGNPVYARGNIANALLFEGNTASAIENAIGGAGDDILIANLVANGLTGNGGVDMFKWNASGDAGTGALADTILDFLSGTDKIDLAAIDAIPASGGDEAFAFIGNAAFHNVAGEVRYDVVGNAAHVFADLDGNGLADMQIIVSNNTILTASDFML